MLKRSRRIESIRGIRKPLKKASSRSLIRLNFLCSSVACPTASRGPVDPRLVRVGRASELRDRLIDILADGLHWPAHSLLGAADQRPANQGLRSGCYHTLRGTLMRVPALINLIGKKLKAAKERLKL